MAIKTEEGHETILISLMGIADCDIAYYFARALNAAGQKVLVVDNTIDAELFSSIRKPDNEDMAQTGEMYWLKHKAYSEEFFALYDYVIICHGMRMDRELNVESDYRFLVTDYRPQTAQALQRELETQEENLKYYVIFRNKVFSKISEKMVLEEIGLPEKDTNETYQLSYAEQDYACYMGLLRNGSANVKTASTEMKDLMSAFYTLVMPQTPVKEQKSYYKKLLAGKIR